MSCMNSIPPITDCPEGPIHFMEPVSIDLQIAQFFERADPRLHHKILIVGNADRSDIARAFTDHMHRLGIDNTIIVMLEESPEPARLIENWNPVLKITYKNSDVKKGHEPNRNQHYKNLQRYHNNRKR